MHLPTQSPTKENYLPFGLAALFGAAMAMPIVAVMLIPPPISVPDRLLAVIGIVCPSRELFWVLGLDISPAYVAFLSVVVLLANAALYTPLGLLYARTAHRCRFCGWAACLVGWPVLLILAEIGNFFVFGFRLM